MESDRGYVCARHEEFTIGNCRWCEPVKEDHKAAAPRPSPVTMTAFTPTGLPPPLRNHYVIATRSDPDCTVHYLCQCGMSARFPEMAAHLQSGNASNASAASAAPKALP